MGTLNHFAFKQRKYMPVFPKATGKPTIYIEGYPYEDDQPMPATEFHAEQVRNLADQLIRYFAIHPHVHIGIDTFIYYREGDMTKFVAPDVHVVLGAAKFPLRRSFYTWSEGAVPAVIFEFLSDATADQDRGEKVQVHLRDMGAQEYFIHQPEMEKPSEFRGWRQDLSGSIVEMEPDAEGGLFSETLNLYFRWENQQDTQVRLLRPYLPDGTPITTSMEEHSLRIEAETRAEAAETRAEAAEQERQEMEAELKRIRQQLAHRQDNDIS